MQLSFIERRANMLIDEGIEAVGRQDFLAAHSSFRAAASVFKTAQTLTYLGVVESALGRIEAAITLCHEAMALDPDYGEAYNDLGTYLVKLGRLDEAVLSFKKAIASKNMKQRHYPHLNLGKIYLEKKHYAEAYYHLSEGSKEGVDDVTAKLLSLLAEKLGKAGPKRVTSKD